MITQHAWIAFLLNVEKLMNIVGIEKKEQSLKKSESTVWPEYR